MIRKLLLSLVVLSAAICGAAQEAGEWKKLKSDVKLMVANDLGRNGYYQQKPIAELMGKVAEAYGPDAVLALGDVHHYGGVQSVSDPLWMTNFELIYSHPELMVDWYPVLGNHEYRGDTQSVIDYSDISRRWMMPARYYTRRFKDNGTSVRVVFLDTPPLIDKYVRKHDTYPDASSQPAEEQLRWLDSTLTTATDDWIIVVGHHPLYAGTDKAASERTDMQQRVDRILRAHNVDMYICGHIHNFQHIRRQDSDIDYIVNTSGSRARKVEPAEGMVFGSDSAGFSLLSASAKELTLYMIDDKGNVIHRVVRKK